MPTSQKTHPTTLQGRERAFSVEVFVTDRAEWRRRTQDVSASFEAGIAASAVVLVDRPAGAVRWDKEIGLADNNTDEALGRLDRPDIDSDTVAAMAPRIARAATAVSAIAADELDAVAPDAREVTRAQEIIELADGTVAAYDLRTGTRIDPGTEYHNTIRFRWDTGGDVGLGW